MYGNSLWWRESAKQPKLMMFDGRVIILILFAALHLRTWTVALALGSMFVLFFFARKGISADSILRYLRTALNGRRRTARGLHEERSAVDYGFETVEMLEQEDLRRMKMIKAHQAAEEKKAAKMVGRARA